MAADPGSVGAVDDDRPPLPLVIAHRGASAYAPGNSLEAFALAIEQGADAVELDVRLGPDGRLLVVHDPLPPAPGTTPPELQAVLELCAGRIGLDLELKEVEPADAALDAVRAVYPDPGDVVVTSFLPEAVARTRDRWPEVRAGLLLDERGVADAGAALAAVQACGATAVAVAQRLVERDGTAWAVAAGLPVYVWTVNEPAALTRFLTDPDVVGVITDVPDTALALRDAA